MNFENMEIGTALTVFAGVIALLVIAISVMIIPLLGYWNLFVSNDWGAYWFWASIGITIGRISTIIFGLVAFVIPLWNKKVWLWVTGISSIVLGIWGYPIYYESLNALIFTELSGILLQRNILIVIIICFWSLTITRSIQDGMKKEQKTET